jgi:hypothetical protein
MLIAWNANEHDEQLIRTVKIITVMAKPIPAKVKTLHTNVPSAKGVVIKMDIA